MPDQTLCELIPLEPVQETEIAASSLENIVFDEPTLSELNPLKPVLETEIAAPSLENIIFDEPTLSELNPLEPEPDRNCCTIIGKHCI